MGFRREQRTSRPGQVGGFFPSTQASALVALEQGVCRGSPGTRTQNQRIKSPMRCHCASDPGRARGYARATARLGPGRPCRPQPTKLTVPSAACSASDQRRLLLARALSVFAAWPAARPTLAVLELLLGPSDAARPGRLLLGVLDPADELVASQRRDVRPGIECRCIGDQRLTQVSWKLVHHATGNLRAAHRARVTVSCQPRCRRADSGQASFGAMTSMVTSPVLVAPLASATVPRRPMRCPGSRPPAAPRRRAVRGCGLHASEHGR